MSTTKRIELYLEAASLWNMFYGEPGANLVEYCLAHQNIHCSSSIWSHLEVHRAVQKRINQKEISLDEGRNLRMFIDSRIAQLVARKKLVETEVTRGIIDEAKQLISTFNIYASDTLHFATALSNSCIGVLVDDFHFTRLSKKIREDLDIVILHISMSVEQLQENLTELKNP